MVYGQEVNETMMMKKWYYCDQVTVPDSLETKLFYVKEEGCKSTGNHFYWEFKRNGEYCWSQALHDETTGIIDGLIAVPNDKWKIDGDMLYVGSNRFVIDVINDENLLIHRAID